MEEEESYVIINWQTRCVDTVGGLVEFGDDSILIVGAGGAVNCKTGAGLGPVIAVQAKFGIDP